MLDDRMKIIIACHKACEVPSDDLYLPIQVGAAGKDDIGFTRDDTGDHISEINPAFSELTGLYWAWKNLKCRYLGLSHYRRYFSLSKKDNQNPLNNVLTKEELEPLLRRYKMIVPKKRNYYIETLYSHYAHTFDGHHLDVTREILQEKYPEYVSSFDDVMKQRSGYMFNMFIMRKKLSDEYCAWLFDILFELVVRIGTEGMSDFEKRYPGRISERLFNVWLHYQLKSESTNESDIFELPVISIEKVNWLKKGSSFLAAKFTGKKYKKSF